MDACSRAIRHDDSQNLSTRKYTTREFFFSGAEERGDRGSHIIDRYRARSNLASHPDSTHDDPSGVAFIPFDLDRCPYELAYHVGAREKMRCDALDRHFGTPFGERHGEDDLIG